MAGPGDAHGVYVVDVVVNRRQHAMEEVHRMLAVKPTRTSASSGSTKSSTQHLNTTAVTASKVEQICPVASLMRVMLSGGILTTRVTNLNAVNDTAPLRNRHRCHGGVLGPTGSYCLGKNLDEIHLHADHSGLVDGDDDSGKSHHRVSAAARSSLVERRRPTRNPRWQDLWPRKMKR